MKNAATTQAPPIAGPETLAKHADKVAMSIYERGISSAVHLSSPRTDTTSSSAISPSTPQVAPLHALERTLEQPTLKDLFKFQSTQKWKAPVHIVVFCTIGLVLSIAHCVIYSGLDGRIVGDATSQEEQLRYGTALSFLVQLALTASVWESYTQWLWWAVYRKQWSRRGLDKAFSVDTTPSSLLSLQLIKNFKLGIGMAFFACTKTTRADQEVSYLAIAHSDAGRFFAYSPPTNSNTTKFLDDTSRIFTGPRTILTLISGATARGEILPIEHLYNHSTYSIDFFGPIVKCDEANMTTAVSIKNFLDDYMSVPLGTASANESAYFAFVPVFDDNGGLTSQYAPRYQSPSNGTNELWMTFQRFVINEENQRTKERRYQTCRLFNATYHLDLLWEGNFQRINGTYSTQEQIFFPRDKLGDVSNMAQHAYTAFMWAVTDQIVGSFTWYEEHNPDPYHPAQFGNIQSPVQGNSLLGSSDLDVFFEFQYEKGLYKLDPDTGISPQRIQDKALARNRTLAVLIEELSFNMTASLLHNKLLTYNTTTEITWWDDVNRYGYSRTGLFIPYALANAFTLICSVLGVASCVVHGPHPGKKVQDIIAAANLLISRTDVGLGDGPFSTDSRRNEQRNDPLS